MHKAVISCQLLHVTFDDLILILHDDCGVHSKDGRIGSVPAGLFSTMISATGGVT